MRELQNNINTFDPMLNIFFIFPDLQNVDAIVDKQYQQRNEQQSEALSALVREELQIELNRGLNALQEGTIRTIRDSIRDNLNQQLTEITNARYESINITANFFTKG